MVVDLEARGARFAANGHLLRTVLKPSPAGRRRLLFVGLPGLRFAGWDRIWARRRNRVRRFELLRWTGRVAIAKVLHLLRAQGTTGVDRLNRALLLGERRLNRRRWSLVDERARLLRGARRGPLELGRNRLCANGGRLSHLRGVLDRGLRDYRWPHRGALRARPVGR
jgi:hypothetical protein